jgi:hypothetical protein
MAWRLHSSVPSLAELEPDITTATSLESDRRQPAHRPAAARPQGRPFGMRLRGWRWEMRARLSEHSPYLALARARHGSALSTGETELVIDGFPRCGNSFAVVAFQLAQPAPCRVSHHIHSAANIISATKRGTPVVVTIREPEAAVLSCVIREPYVSIRQALTAYIALYERLQRRHHSFLVADFHEITTDMGIVTDKVNDRFGTSFSRFAHTPESVAECFAIIEDRARRPPWAEHIGRFLSGTATLDQLQDAAKSWEDDEPLPIPEHRVGRPSPERVERKRELQAAYLAPDLTQLRAKAQRVYETLTHSC